MSKSVTLSTSSAGDDDVTLIFLLLLLMQMDMLDFETELSCSSIDPTVCSNVLVPLVTTYSTDFYSSLQKSESVYIGGVDDESWHEDDNLAVEMIRAFLGEETELLTFGVTDSDFLRRLLKPREFF